VRRRVAPGLQTVDPYPSPTRLGPTRWRFEWLKFASSLDAEVWLGSGFSWSSSSSADWSTTTCTPR